ncbi:MAG: hypothetical protein GX196_07615 [Clostridiaceae bacterium]|nr:hypothetical protein [Clostridiaceae bacterium]
MIEVTKVNYKSFKDCVKVSNGEIELIATTQVGPRIIRFGFIGKDNMFFEDENNQIGHDLSKYHKFNDTHWHIYGGHRLWAAPEIMPRTYYPDNEPVDYEITNTGVILRAKNQVYNQLQNEIEISVLEDKNTVKVIHRIKNNNAWAVTFAPWALSVMAPGGKEFIPMPDKDTGYFPNRFISLWKYTSLQDERLYLGERYITLKQRDDLTREFKIGVYSQHAWAAYVNKGFMFVKEFEVIPGAQYADNNANYQTYTNHLMLEMESLGVLKSVEPGEYNEHTEVWHLYKDVPEAPENESGFDEYFSKYIKK